MSGDVHVQFLEGLRVKFPRSTQRAPGMARSAKLVHTRLKQLDKGIPGIQFLPGLIGYDIENIRSKSTMQTMSECVSTNSIGNQQAKANWKVTWR